MASKPQRTIAADCSHIVSAFNQLISKLAEPTCNTPDLASTDIQDQQGRFHVWAGNIGALQSPGSLASLDSRLKDAPQIRAQILKILARLIQSIKKGKYPSTLKRIELMAPATLITSGELPNKVYTLDVDELEISDSEEDGLSPVSDDDTSVSPTASQISEIAELQRAINDTITNLFKLSIAIRKPTPRGRYAASKSLPPFDASYDIAHVQHKFSLISEQIWLAERLGKAITRRREYFRYRRVHRTKLGHQASQPEEEKEEGRVAGLLVEQEVAVSRSQPDERATTITQTKATTFVDSSPPKKLTIEHEDAVSLTSYATSVEENSLHALRVPDPQSLGGMPFEYGKAFECPYCLTIQNVQNWHEWKYVCVRLDVMSKTDY